MSINLFLKPPTDIFNIFIDVIFANISPTVFLNPTTAGIFNRKFVLSCNRNLLQHLLTTTRMWWWWLSWWCWWWWWCSWWCWWRWWWWWWWWWWSRSSLFQCPGQCRCESQPMFLLSLDYDPDGYHREYEDDYCDDDDAWGCSLNVFVIVFVFFFFGHDPSLWL